MFKLEKLTLKDKVDYLLFLSIPLVSLFMIEYAARGSLFSVISWPVHEPLQFFASLLLFYGLYLFLWANLNNRGVAALSYSIIWILIAAVAGCKRVILGTTLMPWDILTGTDVASLFGGISLSQLGFLTNPVFLILLAINLFMIIKISLTQKGKHLKVRWCNLLTVLCCIAVAAVFFTLPKADPADSAGVCDKDGYIRGFIVSAQVWAKMDDTDAIASALENSDSAYDFTAAAATTDVRPNVIFIMSETFSDVTLLPNLTFSEDPLPNFHALAKSCPSGNIVSPVYGGLTDNVEFEVMTGFSMKYFPYGTSIFDGNVKQEIPSIPLYFKNLGYESIALHPNSEAFFNRNVIYPLLGFDDFVSLEDMPDIKIKGQYPSDDSFADYIISTYKNAKKPVCMYDISVQNHWPYTTDNYYETYDIGVSSSKELDAESMKAIQNYTQGIHDADASLKKIIDYFNTVDEPTVVVFFGDHLPALTDEFGVYKKLGYVDGSLGMEAYLNGLEGTANENAFIEYQKMFKTPYLIWNNYDAEMGKGETMSANYLGVYTMSEIGLPLPPFYNFMLDYAKQLPVNRYFLSIDAGGRPFKETPAIYSNYETVYRNVQLDMMLGEQTKWDLFEF